MSNIIVNRIRWLIIFSIIFIVFKFIGVIHWSWFWVLSPFLIPIILIGFIILSLILVILIGAKPIKFR